MDSDQTPQEQVEVEPDELHALRDFLRQHGLRLAIGAGVAVLIVLAVSIYRGRADAARQQAMQMLMSARTLQDLQVLIDEHPGAAAAPLALLKSAKLYYDSGDYDTSLNKYDAFTETYGDHEMADAARMGRLHCLEARYQLDEALAGYEAFAAENAGHFLESQAHFGRARCLQELGRLEEARTVYEDFMAANPDSGWLQRAEERLRVLTDKIEAARDGESAAVPLTAPAMVPEFNVPDAPAAEGPVREPVEQEG